MKAPPNAYETSGQKIQDFLIGFLGWFIGNAALWCFQSTLLPLMFLPLSLLPRSGDQSQVTAIFGMGLSFLCGILILAANIGVPIFFLIRRRWIGIGMLGAIAASLLLILLLTAACFVLYQGQAAPNPAMTETLAAWLSQPPAAPGAI
jgi:hypothetical protein